MTPRCCGVLTVMCLDTFLLEPPPGRWNCTCAPLLVPLAVSVNNNLLFRPQPASASTVLIWTSRKRLLCRRRGLVAFIIFVARSLAPSLFAQNLSSDLRRARLARTSLHSLSFQAGSAPETTKKTSTKRNALASSTTAIQRRFWLASSWMSTSTNTHLGEPSERETDTL